MKRKSGAHSAVMKLLLFTLVVAAFYGSYYLGSLHSPQKQGLQNYVALENPQPITNLMLLDQYGKPFDERRLLGHWNLVIFGNTGSVDSASQSLILITQVKNRLAINPDLQKATRGLFVTVDPEADTPEVLLKFMARFSPDFLALTGPAEAIDSFARLFGKDIEHLSKTGNTKFRSSIALINPNASLIGRFTGTMDTASIAADITQLALNQEQ